jgi:hypothetical protein
MFRKYEKETPLPTPTYKVNKWMRKDQDGRTRRDQEKSPMNDEVPVPIQHFPTFLTDMKTDV